MRCGVIACLLYAGVAHADPAGDVNPEAEKLFRDGRAFLKDGNTAAACDAFAASAKLGPSVGTFLNLGDCRARRGEVATAWAAFVEAGRLAVKLDDPRKAEADRRAAELEPQLSYLTIDVPTPVPGLKIARDNVAIDPSVWHEPTAIDPGAHTVVATAPGFAKWAMTFEVAPSGAKAVAHVPALRAIPVAPAAAPAVRTPDRFTTTRIIGVVSAGAGVAALAGSLALALDAEGLEDDARTTCPTGTPCTNLGASQESGRAVTRANIATAIGAAGIVAITGGVFLWIVGRPREGTPPPIAATATRDSFAVSLTGRF